MSYPLELDGLLRETRDRSVREDPLDRLATATHLAHELESLGDQLVGHFVDAARDAGYSWSRVGEVLGVTRQGAHQRFGYPKRTAMTQAALRAWERAEQDARELGCDYLGTEHVLFGLIRETDGVAFRALGNLGVSLASAQQKWKQLTGYEPAERADSVSPTPKAKKVTKLAGREARRLGHDRPGTGHVLLALVREPDSLAARVLVDVGADASRVQREVDSLFVMVREH